ncbi:MAG: hypothetical protein K940chlam7_01894 [Chlamydiae bacterium]|nr:hypothetical protein [Chlamydiota bacterium]
MSRRKESSLIFRSGAGQQYSRDNGVSKRLWSKNIPDPGTKPMQMPFIDESQRVESIFSSTKKAQLKS